MSVLSGIPRFERAVGRMDLWEHSVLSGTVLGTKAITETLLGYGKSQGESVVLLEVGHLDLVKKAVKAAPKKEHQPLVALTVVPFGVPQDTLRDHLEFIQQFKTRYSWIHQYIFYNIPEPLLVKVPDTQATLRQVGQKLQLRLPKPGCKVNPIKVNLTLTPSGGIKEALWQKALPKHERPFLI